MSRLDEIRARVEAERRERILANGHPADDGEQPSEVCKAIASSMGYVEPKTTFDWRNSDVSDDAGWLTVDSLQKMMDQFAQMTLRDLPFTQGLFAREPAPTLDTVTIDGVEYRFHDLDPDGRTMQLYRDNGIDPSTVRNDP